MERKLGVSYLRNDLNRVPDLLIVIKEKKEHCTLIFMPSLRHESRTDCERGRKVFLLKRSVRVPVVLVRFIIIVQREVESPQRVAKWN